MRAFARGGIDVLPVENLRAAASWGPPITDHQSPHQSPFQLRVPAAIVQEWASVGGGGAVDAAHDDRVIASLVTRNDAA